MRRSGSTSKSRGGWNKFCVKVRKNAGNSVRTVKEGLEFLKLPWLMRASAIHKVAWLECAKRRVLIVLVSLRLESIRKFSHEKLVSLAGILLHLRLCIARGNK